MLLLFRNTSKAIFILLPRYRCSFYTTQVKLCQKRERELETQNTDTDERIKEENI